MRIPLLIAIPLGFLTVWLIWWSCTRKMDFLTPPSEARLEAIRAEALASLPISQTRNDAISIKVSQPAQEAIVPGPIANVEPVDLGDLTSPPVIDNYSNRAPDGAEKILLLAAALEKAGSFQRALLAFERTLDLTQANPEQLQTAITAIQRLKPGLPKWNTDNDKALPIIIHIGTGKKFAKILPDILEKITIDLDSASSGLIKSSYKLNIGRSIQSTDAPTPVALWFTGPEDDSPSTDVLSFTSDNTETLREDLLKTIFNLTRGHLSKSTAYTPAPEALDDPYAALDSHITRLLWQEFGTLLNPK
ncbi:MAG: hypothetical protein H7Y36_00475 [Armatimonadetes bacterium]|nr:hypothetical protein [Akkermansiaceae bacterium]